MFRQNVTMQVHDTPSVYRRNLNGKTTRTLCSRLSWQHSVSALVARKTYLFLCHDKRHHSSTLDRFSLHRYLHPQLAVFVWPGTAALQVAPFHSDLHLGTCPGNRSHLQHLGTCPGNRSRLQHLQVHVPVCTCIVTQLLDHLPTLFHRMDTRPQAHGRLLDTSTLKTDAVAPLLLHP